MNINLGWLMCHLICLLIYFIMKGQLYYIDKKLLHCTFLSVTLVRNDSCGLRVLVVYSDYSAVNGYYL